MSFASAGIPRYAHCIVIPASYNILIVEDEPMISEMYRTVLSKSAYHVLTALNKTAAIELITKHKPNIVLLDLMIPIGPGEELITYDHPVGFDILEWVRHHPDLDGTKIVIITNLDSLEHKRHAEQLGAIDYLVKANFGPKDIVKHVDALLKA